MFEFGITIELDNSDVPTPGEVSYNAAIAQLIADLILLTNVGTPFTSFSVLLCKDQVRIPARSKDTEIEMIPTPKRFCIPMIDYLLKAYPPNRTPILIHGQPWRIHATEVRPTELGDALRGVTVSYEPASDAPVRTPSQGETFLTDHFYSSDDLMAKAGAHVLFNRAFHHAAKEMVLTIQNRVVTVQFKSGSFFSPVLKADEDIPLNFGNAIVTYLIKNYSPESMFGKVTRRNRVVAVPIAVNKPQGIAGGVRVKFKRG